MNKPECEILRGLDWTPIPLAWIRKGDIFRMRGASDTYKANESAVHDEDGWHVDADWYRGNVKEDVERVF